MQRHTAWKRPLGAVRAITACALLTLVGSARAESVQGFLHCTPKTDGEFSTTHEIVLYFDKADVDDWPYTLASKPDSFVLAGPTNTVADMLNPSSQIIINRITGEYLILNGFAPESGTCVKVQRKF